MQKNRKKVKRQVVTLEAVAEEFYKSNIARGLSPETCRAYQDYIKAFVKWFGGYRSISEVRPAALDGYIVYNKDKGLQMITVATKMKHIRRFLNFSAERNYSAPIKVSIPRYELTLKDPYTDAEMAKLLEGPTSRDWVEWRNWAMVNYFFSTGQRLSTVLNIRVRDIDIETQTVRLLWNKDKRQKIMPLSSALVDVLREYMDMSGFDEDEYLFPQVEGGQLQRRSAQDAISDYNHSRGVQRTSIHLFRHTFAKNYILNGGNPMKLQKLLNHKTLDMTLRYVNLYGDDMAVDIDLYDPLGRHINAANPRPGKRRRL